MASINTRLRSVHFLCFLNWKCMSRVKFGDVDFFLNIRFLLILDKNAWNHLTMCKLFLSKIINWSYIRFQRIMVRYDCVQTNDLDSLTGYATTQTFILRLIERCDPNRVNLGVMAKKWYSTLHRGPCQVGWGCRIHRQHLWREVKVSKVGDHSRG